MFGGVASHSIHFFKMVEPVIDLVNLSDDPPTTVRNVMEAREREIEELVCACVCFGSFD